MSFGRKLISVFALASVFTAFSIVVPAQDTPKPDKPDAMRKDGKRGKQGRKGMRGRGGRQGKPGMRGRGGRMGGNPALKGITLSDSQKTQLQSLFKSNRGEKRPQNDELRELMMAKRSGLATSAQEARLKSIHEEMMTARKTDQEKMNQSIRSILTPEQQTTYDKNIAEGKQRMEERKKKMEEHRKMRKERKEKPDGEVVL